MRTCNDRHELLASAKLKRRDSASHHMPGCWQCLPVQLSCKAVRVAFLCTSWWILTQLRRFQASASQRQSRYCGSFARLVIRACQVVFDKCHQSSLREQILSQLPQAARHSVKCSGLSPLRFCCLTSNCCRDTLQLAGACSKKCGN